MRCKVSLAFFDFHAICLKFFVLLFFYYPLDACLLSFERKERDGPGWGWESGRNWEE